ncbi:hypothetical protein DV738_g871, partial [Chaetothyriales sp. CBS 135597]
MQSIDRLVGHHFAAFEEAWTPVPRLVGMASGTVLELGPGSGNQLPRFDRSAISRIYGIEPNEYLFNLLRDDAVRQHGLGDIYFPINAALEDDSLLDSRGIGAESIDTVVCMQVLCSVPDPARAAEHIHRLLKPGGQLLFWEHQASRDPVTRLVQGEAGPLGPVLSCAIACHAYLLDRLLELDLDPAGRRLSP